MNNQDKQKYDKFINSRSANKEKISKEIKEQLIIKPYTKNDKNNPPELTLSLLAFTTTSIYSDLLDGLSGALQKVNNGEIQLENIKLKGGTGTGTGTGIGSGTGTGKTNQNMVQKNDDSINHVKEQSQEMSQQVKDTAAQVNKQLNKHYENLSHEGNKVLQYILKKW